MAEPVHDPIGSIWRVWDLHFHTPSSYDYKDNSVTNEAIINKLVTAGVSVVAITDHNIIDVDRIEELQTLGKNHLVVLPGIEVRTELGGHNSVHLVAIFPEDSNIVRIWDEIRVKHKLTEQLEERGHEDIYVDFRDFAADVHKLNGLTIVHAGSKANSIEEIAGSSAFKLALKTDIARESSDIFEIANPKNIPTYAKVVFPTIRKELPLILCSDSHSLSGYSAPHCWIKADQSFYGLCQVIYDPWDRVSLTDCPPYLTRVFQDKTKYIKSISFSRTEGSDLPDSWFDNVSIPLNPGLIAIIGNKGSGKSALAETIGLLGGCRYCEHFSFLQKDKFLRGRKPNGMHFKATLEWLDESSITLALNESNTKLEERVRYIPQNYLETICNELGITGKIDKFSSQLEHVIFSHVPPDERAGYETLQSFIEYRTAEIVTSLQLSKDKIYSLNESIIDIERRLSPEYQELLRQGLVSKQNELKVLNDAKPVEVPKPPDDATMSQEMKEKITETERLDKDISDIEQLIRTNTLKQLNEKQAATSCAKLLQAVGNFKVHYEDLKSSWEKEGISAGIFLTEVVQINIDNSPLENRITASKEALITLQAEVNPTVEGSLTSRLNLAKNKLASLRSELSALEQAYQKYLEDEKAWLLKKKLITGEADSSETIKWYEHQLDELQSLPKLLNELKIRREQRVSEIFSILEKWREVYEQAYGPVQSYINEHPIMSEEAKFQFSASMTDTGFGLQFFNIIHQGKRGSFCRDGEATLRKIIEDVDFNTQEGVLRFTREIIDYLQVDKRPNEGGTVSIDEQIKDGKSRIDLYNLLFSLDYLSPSYSLQWSGKVLDQLSPGEKGALLLVFYLLIDKDRGPLLIDQPEENLDNQTVYKILVPCINEARNRRQIVLVTHNPNLAIVCDADQIIRAHLDVDKKNQLSYVSGAIENPIISAAVVDVLEGTKPAFEKREHKYIAAMPEWIV